MSDERLVAIEERLAKLEGGSDTKVKIPKKERPKRPPTAYQLFVKENGSLVRDEWAKEGKVFK